MSRIKLFEETVETRKDAERVMAVIRELTIHRQKLALEREKALKEIDDKYAAGIQKADKQIHALAKALEAWSEAHPEEYGGKKTLSLLHGVCGWRVGMPRLKKRVKRTWADLVDVVKRTLGVTYIRVKEEINRQAIIEGHRNGIITPERLRQAGLQVVQDNTFFAEPHIDDEDLT